MKLFRKDGKDSNPIKARVIPGGIPVTKYVLPEEPKQITNSWVVGHSCFFFHGMDWVYLREFWSKFPAVFIMN